MNNDLLSCSDMILKTMSNIEDSFINDSNKIKSVWKKVITSINKDGQNLFDHSSIIDLKNNILLIETDHPTWTQLFQFNKNYIIKGLKMYVPELGIKNLVFRLKGSNAQLYNVSYSEELEKKQKEINESIEKQQNEINSYFGDRFKNKEISEKLKEKNALLWKTLLTNKENK